MVAVILKYVYHISLYMALLKQLSNIGLNAQFHIVDRSFLALYSFFKHNSLRIFHHALQSF